MYYLVESPVGIAILNKSDELSLVARLVYSTCSEAIESIQSLTDAQNIADLSQPVQHFFSTYLKSGMACSVQSSVLQRFLIENYKIKSCNSTDSTHRNLKHNQFKWFGINKEAYNNFTIQVAHKLFNYKFNDLYVIEILDTIESLSLNLNTRIARLREWYSLHFPELNYIQDNQEYLKYLITVGIRQQFILKKDNSIPKEIIQLAEISMGIDLAGNDIERIKEDAQNILDEFKLLDSLNDSLRRYSEMACPNLVELVGYLVAAKLVRKAGSISRLAQFAGSTIQILGAEKAYSEAVRMMGNTPKYGIILECGLMSQVPIEKRGRIARVLASKAALCIRVDVQENADQNGEFGRAARNKIESIIEIMKDECKVKKPVKKKQKKRIISLQEYDSARCGIKKRK